MAARWTLVLVAALALATCCALDRARLACGAQEEEEEAGAAAAQEQAQVEGPSARPSLFGFNKFKVLFNKSYESAREETRRAQLFLAHLLQAFSSYFGYRHKLSSSYESINQMSDWTPAEFRRTHVSAEQYYRDLPRPSDEELAAALEAAAAAAAAARAATGPDAAPSEAQADESQAIKTGRSEAREPAAGTASKGPLQRWWAGVASAANKLGDMMDRALQSGFMKLTYNRGKYRPELPDAVYIDHRARKSCLNPPRDQGNCGSCYAFATIALYEWAYCALEGSKVKFSEQYVVDCGHLSSSSGLAGCGGGNEISLSKFVDARGLELLDRYRYQGRAHACPYEKGATHKMGLVRMKTPSLSWVYPNQLDQELLANPFLITIYPSRRLQGYGGGVDEGAGCGSDPSELHSVLLVGSGRENGYEYWIIRNSYGTDWGEHGYYRLRKDSPCLANFALGLRLARKANAGADIVPRYNFSANPNYDWRVLARQFKHERPPKWPPAPAARMQLQDFLV